MSFFGDIGHGISSGWRHLTGQTDDEAASRAQSDAQRQQAAAQAIWSQLGTQVPGVDSQRVDPMLEQQTERLGDTAFGGASADPMAIAAQRQALEGLGTPERALQAMLAGGGLDAQDRARIQQSQRGNAMQARAGREAAMQQAASRGMLGGGAELSGMLGAQQGAADRNSQEGLGIEALAQDRRMQVLQGLQSIQGARAGMAGQMRGQSYDEAARTAEARDRIAAWNGQNAQATRGRNADRSNEGRYYNSGLVQQRFGNQAQVAAGATGQYTHGSDQSAGMASQYRQRAEDERNRLATMATGIVKGVAGA